jgi:geranylgeranyl diphosphate synthase, type II
MTASATVDDQLAHYSSLLGPELESYLPRCEPDRYLYRLLALSVGRRGKALRPSICLATCAAFGADPRLCLGPAVALELVHDAFLVHDDIQDGSERRRGHATLHADVGVPLAINAGDALATLSFRPLLDAESRLGSSLTARILREFHHTILTTIEGQAIELGWRKDNVCDLGLDDYLGMVLRKTCCYTTIHPLRVGALVGTRGRADLAALTRFGFFLGAAFQIQDDVLDLTSGPGGYGKDTDGDLYEGKRSVPLVHLLAQCRPVERHALVQFLRLDRWQRTVEAVDWVHALLVAHGSIEFARNVATGISRAATESFDCAFRAVPPTRDLEFLAALVDFVVERSS